MVNSTNSSGWVGLTGKPAQRDAGATRMLRRLGAVLYVKTNIPQSLMVLFSPNLPPTVTNNRRCPTPSTTSLDNASTLLTEPSSPEEVQVVNPLFSAPTVVLSASAQTLADQSVFPLPYAASTVSHLHMPVIHMSAEGTCIATQCLGQC